MGVVVSVGFGPEAQLPAHAEPATLAISPGLSVLEFTISRPGETIEGQAPKFDGQVRFDPARPGEGSVILKVDAAAMVTGNRLRDRKMRNSHLETGRFPEVVFQSTALTLVSGTTATAPAVLRPGETHQAEIEGRLALHGQERSIRFPVSIRYDNGALAAEGGLSLKLTDYAIPI